MLVLLFLAFGTVDLMRPTPEKLHREALAIVSEYGFVKVQRPVPMIHPYNGFPAHEFYDAKGLDDNEIKRIVERLDAACKGCTRSRTPLGGDARTTWSPPDSLSLSLEASVYTSSEGDVVSMDLWMFTLVEHRKPNLWDRVKSWWPW